MNTNINQSNGGKTAAHARISIDEALNKTDNAAKAFQEWKKTSFAYRSSLLTNLAKELKSNKESYAKIATQEMGKTIGQARKEIEKCARICHFYAENAEKFLQCQNVETEATKSYVTFQPLGVILAVMPWNFPFYQVIRFAAPALMAGNTGVLKHASNVQGCAFILEEAFRKAGYPPHVFQNLNIESNLVEQIIADKSIAAVTLTGSDAAGRSVASIAGKHLKKTVLELGGSDPYLILEDADLEFATNLAVTARMQNCGQTCIAGKRFIVVKKVYEQFLELFCSKMKALRMGDPMDEATDYGPIARIDLRDELHMQVCKTIEQGARLVLGGKIPENTGAYYPATILAEVMPGMEAFDNELFGPVAAVIKASDEQDAVRLANLSSFGLGASVITANKELGEKIALQFEAGNCFVNKMVISDPRLPFGGIKQSGYGRELSGYGIREFVNIKTVWVE